jgi:hypothetical protein
MLSPNGAGQLEPASWSGFRPVWSGLPGPRLEWLGPAGQLELLRPKPEARGRASPPTPPGRESAHESQHAAPVKNGFLSARDEKIDFLPGRCDQLRV